mmetsp:Transcript_63838/g.113883  ORF Transcript_63838/g.113883 Transcript_63838/m.113883 type:complete len:391 (-) Transcript_63838:170-1342(-)
MPDAMAMGLGLVHDDPDGGPTVILGEAPSISDRASGAPALDKQAWRDLALSFVSLNEKTAATVDFPQSALEESGELHISCGRGDDNQIVLQDPRVSVRHFSLRVCLGASDKAGAIDIELLDESSNGTWVNDQPVGKGRNMSLVTGDRVFVLPSARVGTQAAIGYVIVALPPTAEVSSQRRARQLGLSPPPWSVPTPCRAGGSGKANEDGDTARQLASHVQCRRCSDALIHKCATTVPCGHNFCLGCIVSWSTKQNQLGKYWPECPVCCAPVRQLVRNHSVDSIIETFVRAHPEASRPESQLKEIDAMERDTANEYMLNRMLFGKHIVVPRPAHRPAVSIQRHQHAHAAANGAGRRPSSAGTPQQRAQPQQSDAQQRTQVQSSGSTACVVS